MRRYTFWTAARRVGLPLVSGGAVLLAAGVSAWPPWAAVLVVAATSGTAPRWRASRDRTDETRREAPVHAMQRPIRPVASHGVPEDASYTVQVTTHSQLALVIAPNTWTGPEGQHVPLTGHNLNFTVTAGSSAVTVKGITAVATGHAAFPETVALSHTHRRMPHLVLSPDLLESLQRSVAAYRPLAPPDVAIFLDTEPADIAMLHEDVGPPPFALRAGASRTLVFAPVTETRHWLHWQLVAEIECDGRTDTVFWNLTVTAETGWATYMPKGDPEWLPVHKLHPDHWDPENPDLTREPGWEREETFDIAVHTSADGTGFLLGPPRPGPEPEPPGATELCERGDAHSAAGRLEEAASAYRQAAEGGSGRAAYALGAVLHAQDDPEQARAWFKQAAAKRIFAAFNSVGVMSALLGDGENAERWFRAAMDEGDWSGAVNLATLLADRGDLGQAETLLTVADRVDVPQSTQRLSALLVGQGRIEEAEKILVQALERREGGHSSFGQADPEESQDLLLHLALLTLNERDDFPAALGWFRRATADGASPETLMTAAEHLHHVIGQLVDGPAPRLADAIDAGKLLVAVHRRLFPLNEALHRWPYDRAIEDLISLGLAAQDTATVDAALTELRRLRSTLGSER